jgi:hypothetical protein
LQRVLRAILRPAKYVRSPVRLSHACPPSFLAPPRPHHLSRSRYHRHRWINTKMTALGVTSSPHFRIAAFYCIGAMIAVTHPRYGPSPVKIKPLPVLWGQHPGVATPANTVMVSGAWHGRL